VNGVLEKESKARNETKTLIIPRCRTRAREGECVKKKESVRESVRERERERERKREKNREKMGDKERDEKNRTSKIE